MATSEEIERLREALSGMSAGEVSGVQTLAEEPADTSDTKDYLGEAGLKRLVELVVDALKGKQDTLTQGDNITIDGDVISAADTGATSVEASGDSPLTLTASYNADTRRMTVGGSVDLSDYAKGDDLKGYLPLTGGTLTGELTVKNTIDCQGNLLVGANMTVDDEVKLKSDLDVEGATSLNLTENTDAPNVVVADGDGKLYKTPVSEIGGGDGKYLPLTGGTVDGSLIVNERLTAHGQTTLNDTVTFGGAAYINLNGENRITVGGDVTDTFIDPPTFAGTDRLLIVRDGMIQSLQLSEFAQWVIDEYGGGSSGGTTSVFWHLAIYDWEISLRNSAEETLGSPVELGLIFADNPYTNVEAQSCPDDCSIVWAQLCSSVPMEYDDDLDGGIRPELDFAKRWFVGFAVRAEALFDVELHISDNTGVDSWDAYGSASRVGASGSSEWGFVPAGAPVDLGALDLTGDGATFQPIVTGEMVMREVN